MCRRPRVVCHRGRWYQIGLAALIAIPWWCSSIAVAQPLEPPVAGSPPAAPTVNPLLVDQLPRNLEEIQALEQAVIDLAQRMKSCTVSVSGGSGVIVSEDGLILTCAHVGGVAGRSVNVRLSDGRQVAAETLGNHHQTDAGMMKLKGEGPWPFAPVAERSEVRPGQWCVAMGFPVSFSAGREPPVRLGRVLRVSESSITTDCLIMGGDSGGPLFDLQGRLIGINSRVSNSVTGNVHVHVGAFHTHWEDLVAGKDQQTGARLGVTADPQSSQAKIGSVDPDSAAERAGIQVGDIIVEFNRQPVGTFEELRSLVSQSRAGQRVRIRLLRGDEEVNLRVELGSR